MRKNCLALAFVSFWPLLHYAQVRIDTTILNTNLFEHFTDGTVLLKNGNIEHAPLNYDTQNQSIVFKKDGQVMILTGLETVDTVYIQNRKFIAAENTFYEVATGKGKIGLFITYSNRRRPLVATTDHAGTIRKANTDVSNTVSGVYLSRPFHGNYAIEIKQYYWLRRGRSFYKANNEDQLLKAFAFKNSDTIRAYIKENKIDFNRQEDVIKLVNYCNMFM
jgi:hypothetical protein